MMENIVLTQTARVKEDPSIVCGFTKANVGKIRSVASNTVKDLFPNGSKTLKIYKEDEDSLNKDLSDGMFVWQFPLFKSSDTKDKINMKKLCTEIEYRIGKMDFPKTKLYLENHNRYLYIIAKYKEKIKKRSGITTPFI